MKEKRFQHTFTTDSLELITSIDIPNIKYAELTIEARKKPEDDPVVIYKEEPNGPDGSGYWQYYATTSDGQINHKDQDLNSLRKCVLKAADKMLRSRKGGTVDIVVKQINTPEFLVIIPPNKDIYSAVELSKDQLLDLPYGIKVKSLKLNKWVYQEKYPERLKKYQVPLFMAMFGDLYEITKGRWDLREEIHWMQEEPTFYKSYKEARKDFFNAYFSCCPYESLEENICANTYYKDGIIPYFVMPCI